MLLVSLLLGISRLLLLVLRSHHLLLLNVLLRVSSRQRLLLLLIVISICVWLDISLSLGLCINLCDRLLWLIIRLRLDNLLFRWSLRILRFERRLKRLLLLVVVICLLSSSTNAIPILAESIIYWSLTSTIAISLSISGVLVSLHLSINILCKAFLCSCLLLYIITHSEHSVVIWSLECYRTNEASVFLSLRNNCFLSIGIAFHCIEYGCLTNHPLLMSYSLFFFNSLSLIQSFLQKLYRCFVLSYRIFPIVVCAEIENILLICLVVFIKTFIVEAFVDASSDWQQNHEGCECNDCIRDDELLSEVFLVEFRIHGSIK